MKCIHCKGTMERGTAPFHIDRAGIHLSFDAMPAWVCKQCGEPLFEQTEVDLIQSILGAIDEQTARMEKAT